MSLFNLIVDESPKKPTSFIFIKDCVTRHLQIFKIEAPLLGVLPSFDEYMHVDLIDRV